MENILNPGWLVYQDGKHLWSETKPELVDGRYIHRAVQLDMRLSKIAKPQGISVSDSVLTSVSRLGVVTPILVRKGPTQRKFHIIDGNHRYLECHVLGKKTIPVLFHDFFVEIDPRPFKIKFPTKGCVKVWT